MKKILLAAIAVGMMSTSAMALVGTVEKIQIKSDGEVTIVLKKLDGTGNARHILAGTADANKAMLAAALTAKSTSATVEMYNDATSWTNITLITAP